MPLRPIPLRWVFLCFPSRLVVPPQILPYPVVQSTSDRFGLIAHFRTQDQPLHNLVGEAPTPQGQVVDLPQGPVRQNGYTPRFRPRARAISRMRSLTLRAGIVPVNTKTAMRSWESKRA